MACLVHLTGSLVTGGGALGVDKAPSKTLISTIKGLASEANKRGHRLKKVHL